MSEGTVRYDVQKNIVYVVAGETHQGNEYIATGDKWRQEVKNKGLKNYNTILDLSKVDPKDFHPGRSEGSGDPAYYLYGFEDYVTRRDGNGKLVLVISGSKGGTPLYDLMFKPDAIVLSLEDAEEFILTGHLYDRT